MIRVVFFGSGFLGRSASGTGEVFTKLIQNLLAQHKELIEITLLIRNISEKKAVENHPEFSKCKILILPDVKYKTLRTSRQYFKFIRNFNGPMYDVLHFSVARLYPFFWKFPAKKIVCTFHAAGDITVPVDKFIISRHVYNLIAKLYWMHLDAIYAVSDFAVKEISENYKIPLNKITRIHPGTDTLWNLDERELQNFDKSKINIVIMGRWQKYKNVHTVINALRDSQDFSLGSCNIYLIGKSNQLGNNLVNKSISKFPKEHLTQIEYLPFEQLKYLYNSANLIVHPSINEGFGLPAFEAFGEGATLLVHNETPAADYLANFAGVFVTDLLVPNKIIDQINKSLLYSGDTKSNRRHYLEMNEMTWAQMSKNYLKSYTDLLDKKQY